MSRWYIIHAYSGFENKVRDAILSEAQRMGLTLDGTKALARAFPGWFELYMFAHIPPARRARS